MALELLSPAGSPEGVRAAVKNGADAIYLGLGSGMNARRGAKNFTNEEFREAAAWCRTRGVKTYVTLNTLVYDREAEAACDLARFVSEAGADAVLVQDLGLAAVLKKALPDLPLHASTQMSIHNLDGVKRAADLGMSRAVLARELSRRDIAYICEHAPIEIEVFAHGALCFCYSGQCYFSSVIGGRSGNRGACAQPCRLTYGFGGKAKEYPLSLKDLSLASHLRELEEIGVRCIKIEGRMKRPEYAALATRVFAEALQGEREPTREEMRMLELVFSRSGFTDGYFTGTPGPDMLGIREEADPDARSEVAKLFRETR
ncbi:MAG: U32 family peptidase, partial [Oscillospiraceae bacterium]|nr:U32 family peptidase [Oscillospiraceae bacterium]